eukprot:scaffold63_cov306-Pinguiococcus_pyrenoidosus.AAC.36
MIRRDWQAHFTFCCGQRVEQAGRRTIQARLAVHGRGRVVHVDVFQQGVYPPEVVRDGLNGRHDLRLRAALPCKTRTLLKLCITLRKMFSQVEELSYVVLIRLLGFPTRTPAGLVRIGITIGLRPVPSAHEERRVEARLGQVHAVRVRRRQLQELGVEVLARPLPVRSVPAPVWSRRPSSPSLAAPRESTIAFSSHRCHFAASASARPRRLDPSAPPVSSALAVGSSLEFRCSAAGSCWADEPSRTPVWAAVSSWSSPMTPEALGCQPAAAASYWIGDWASGSCWAGWSVSPPARPDCSGDYAGGPALAAAAAPREVELPPVAASGQFVLASNAFKCTALVHGSYRIHPGRDAEEAGPQRTGPDSVASGAPEGAQMGWAV